MGYKYVGLCLILLAGFVWPKYGPLVVWVYFGISYAVFLLRSLKYVLFPESMNGLFGEQRKNRVYFMLIVVFIQTAFSYCLIIEPKWSLFLKSDPISATIKDAVADANKFQ